MKRSVPSIEEGAGNAACALHPRSRVQSAQKETHTSIQVQRRHSGIPCAMALRLMPRSPRRRIRLVTVAAGLIADRIRLDRFRHRQLGTSNGCRNHTVLPYATTPFVCAPFDRSRVWLNPKPALQFTCSPDAVASTASNPASVTIAIRPSVGSDGGIPKAVSSKPARGIFSAEGLDKRAGEGLR